jgi:cellulose synthase/poly-beta-1,6-N-acetylglucosamine synthase-like glycosyltransferase
VHPNPFSSKFRTSPSGKSAALNLGLTFCTGDLVIVGDIDTSFDRYAIERVIEPFVDPSVGGVSGNIGVRNYRTSVIASFQAIEYLITISLGRHLSDLLGIVLIASGAFAAFRRDALVAIGGWDVGPGEDANIHAETASCRLESAICAGSMGADRCAGNPFRPISTAAPVGRQLRACPPCSI